MPADAQFDVFLSHSSQDKPVVRAIAELLRQAGLRVWFDEWEIGIGDSIFSKIEQGLEQSRILLFCMSANAFGADWAILETQTVRFRDPLNKKRLFVPLRLDDAEIKGTLQQFKYLDWRKPDEASWRGLLALFDKSSAETEADCAASAAPLPSDSERIEQTRQAILICLHRDHFSGIPKLTFTPDGMPQLLAEAFSAQPDSASTQRIAVADACIYAVLKFGRELVEAFSELPNAAPVATEKNKNRLWKHLVNAMQHAILLSAKQNATEQRRINDAFNPANPCQIESMSWLSASVVMRPKLAESLRSAAEGPGSMQDSHADDWSEVEMGTGESGRNQACKAIKYMLDRGSFPDKPSPQQIDELQGQARLRKRDGVHLLVMNQQTGKFAAEFVQWLNAEMHVGLITILARHGEFDLKEGEWRACLAELLKVMVEFEPPLIRP